MNYDFDAPTQRRGTGSYKWDTVPDDVLPMWVADMDFRTAPCIIDALQKRVEHGIFGYTHVGDEYYQATIDWFARRHGWNISRDYFIYTSGVVPALSAIIKAMTSPGDKVIVNTPAYNCFFSSIRNNGCQLAANPMLIAEDGKYHIDFAGLRRLAADPKARVLILCNPHNPGGRVWTREELTEISQICLENDVFVISDEIHCELTYPGYDYTPYATISEEAALHSAVCISPSKAFNTAGLQIANIIIPDERTRAAVDRAINDNEVCDVNPFGVVGAIAAYREGEDWLEQLKAYLLNNLRTIKFFYSDSLPQLKIMPLESTYLAWIDCSELGVTSDELDKLLVEDAKVQLSPGSIYGEAGRNFMRLNFACQQERLLSGLISIRDTLYRHFNL